MCVALVCIAKCVWILLRLTLTVHINGVVVEMESSLLLHITHAIIPLASQCASSVIRWKQTPSCSLRKHMRENFWASAFEHFLHTGSGLCSRYGTRSSMLLPSNMSFSSSIFPFAHRTKRRPTIKATNMPGNSKPWRPRRTGSDEVERPQLQGRSGSETENENETETR